MIVDLAKPPEDVDVSWEMLWRFYLVPCFYLAPGLIIYLLYMIFTCSSSCHREDSLTAPGCIQVTYKLRIHRVDMFTPTCVCDPPFPLLCRQKPTLVLPTPYGLLPAPQVLVKLEPR